MCEKSSAILKNVVLHLYIAIWCCTMTNWSLHGTILGPTVKAAQNRKYSTPTALLWNCPSELCTKYIIPTKLDFTENAVWFSLSLPHTFF